MNPIVYLVTITTYKGCQTRTYYVEGNTAQAAMRTLKHRLGKDAPTVLDRMHAQQVDRVDVPSVFPIVKAGEEAS